MLKKGYVTTDHDHFKKSKLEYRNWIQALFREGIQNSTDADSSTIKINYFYKDNLDKDLLTIQFEDNGTGMSLDTLLNVLLKMGGSKKEGDNNIGGFGYAKSILFFAHENYLIKTRNFEVKGRGGEYTYSEVDDYLNGTFFEIQIKNDYYYTDINNINKYIEEILAFSHLPKINFIINGKKNKIKSKEFKYNIESNIGKVSFSDNGFGNYSSLWVRVNGLAMFEHSTYQEMGSVFQGIIELNDIPTKMLTANRDGLQHKYTTNLNSIFQDLSKKREKLTYQGMFNFTINKNNNLETIYTENDFISDSPIKPLKEEKIIFQSDNNKNHSPELKTVFKDLTNEKDVFDTFFNKAIQQVKEESYPVNFMITTEKTEDKKISTYKKFFKELLKNKNIKIAIMWDIITSNILKTNTLSEFVSFRNNQFYNRNYPIYKGFVFGNNDTFGSNITAENEHCIAINPSSKYVNLSYECILDIAIHECTHFIVKDHNASFCFQEFIIRRDIQNELKHKNIKKEIKDALRLIKRPD